jgi:hypothetical protein
MSLKKKTQVAIAFAFRIPIVIFSVLHFIHLAQYPIAPQPLYSVTEPLIDQQAMLLWSLISATIPNLKTFMLSFSLDFGQGVTFGNQTKSSDHASHIVTIGSAESKGLPKTNRSASWADSTLSDGLSSSLRPDPHQHNTTVVHSAGEKASIGSFGSQDLNIKKVVDWHVRSESNDYNDVPV